MAFKVITPVATEPVSLADARLHVRLTDGDGTAEDSLILAWITAAREFCEHYTRRALAPQTLEMALDAFPTDEIQFDRMPVTAVASVKYIDTSGVEQTLAADKYALNDYGLVHSIAPTYGNQWPATRQQPNAVKVQFTAGGTDLPAAARAAILLIVGHLFDHREEVVVDARVAVQELPLGVLALLDTIRIWGL